jgi:AraC-like DNA-binding protein
VGKIVLQERTRTTELRIERGAALHASRRIHSRPAILLCLDVTVVEMTRAGSTPELLDRSTIALVPHDAPYRLRRRSPTCALLTIEIGDGAKEDAAHDYGPHLQRDELDALFTIAAKFPRTRWFDEIAQRYLFEREVCQKTTSRAARFLEAEIAKEIYYLAKEKKKTLARASVVSEQTDLVKRAVATIEKDLFHPLRVAALAHECHTSESTLLRAFRKDMGVAPATYQRDRRLDEALLLLRAQRFGVGEVATRVGYTNLAAFTSAFHRRFGVTPSSIAQDDRTGPTLPPHGMVPVPPRKRAKR